MRLGSFIKQPAEKLQYIVNYVAWLDAGETVDSVSISVLPDTDIPLVVSAETVQSPVVSYFLEGGEHGVNYVLTIDITTSIGQRKQDEVFYTVTDIR